MAQPMDGSENQRVYRKHWLSDYGDSIWAGNLFGRHGEKIHAAVKSSHCPCQ
jgi:hypothetical protein